MNSKTSIKLLHKKVCVLVCVVICLPGVGGAQAGSICQLSEV